MKEVIKELARLKEIFNFLNCLETGTIRSYYERHESTRHISEVIEGNGKLKSIDIEPESIKISKNICKNAENVEWILSPSVDYLKTDKDEYEFVLLDSVNDKDYIFEEFTHIAKRVKIGGSIMVDDAGVDTEKKVDQTAAVKGIKVNKFLLENDIPYSVVRGGHGTQLLIPITEETKQKLGKLL